MSEIETRVSVKNSTGDVVSADVVLYNDKGDVVKKVCIIESETLESLQDTISTVSDVFVSHEELSTVLVNSAENTTINATRLGGLNSGQFALKTEIPSDYAPKKHASKVSTDYGSGSKTEYGHVKLRDDLSAVNYQTGEALSSYQGKVLNDKITVLSEGNDEYQEFINRNSLQIIMGRYRPGLGYDGWGESVLQIRAGTGDGIVCKVISYDDSIDLDGRPVLIRIDGIANIYRLTLHKEGDDYLTSVLPININAQENYWVSCNVNNGKGSYYVSAECSCVMQVGVAPSYAYKSFH